MAEQTNMKIFYSIDLKYIFKEVSVMWMLELLLHQISTLFSILAPKEILFKGQYFGTYIALSFVQIEPLVSTGKLGLKTFSVRSMNVWFL